MPSTDQSDKRMFDNEMRRHTEKIAQLAERIAEYSAYLLRDVAKNPAEDQWARDIEASVVEMRRRMAAVEALHEVRHIVAAVPATP